MSNSLADVLAQKDFDEPPEMRAIKQYVQATFQSEVEVMVRDRDIVITSPGASLATSLRLRQSELRRAAGTDKKFIFRIR